MPPRQNSLKVHTAQDLNTLNSPNIIENRELRVRQVRPWSLAARVPVWEWTNIDPNIVTNVLSAISISGNIQDDSSVGTLSWANPSFAQLVDGAFATTGGGASSGQSHYLKATSWGFSIPTNATITGIMLSITRRAGRATSDNIKDTVVSLVLSTGSIGSTNKADTVNSWPTSVNTTNYGNSTDLWGASWAPSDINNINFGAVLSITETNLVNGSTASVDAFSITVWYTVGPVSFNQELLISPFQLVKVRGPGRVPIWEWTTIDAMMPNFSYTATKTEAITNTDTLLKASQRSLTDSITVTDSIIRTLQRTLSDAITNTDTLSRAITYVLSEAITLTDTCIRTIQRTLSEAISLTDTFLGIIAQGFSIEYVQKLARPIIRPLRAIMTNTTIDAMMPNFTFTATKTEAITVSDSLLRTLQRSLNDAITLTDTLLKTLQRTLSESITVSDTFFRAITAVRSEAITVTDTLIRTLQRTVSEAITLSDTFLGAITHFLTLIQAITTTDTFVRSTARVLSEAITVTDGFMRSTARILIEAISLTDTVAAVRASKNAILSEAVVLSDSMVRATTYVRKFIESVVLTDTLTRRLNGVIIIWSHVQKSANATWTKAQKSASSIWTHISRN